MLHVHRSERADRLVDGLAALLWQPPADPFAEDVVAVPARGVERWVTQRLAHTLGAGTGGDGVCARVRFPHPSDLVAEAVARAAGIAPQDDPWDPGRLVWPLLETVDGCLDQPWCRALADHLGVAAGDGWDHRRGRRLATARHLAVLFDSYAAHRPAMLAGWSRGADTDGSGAELPADLRWQAELWRRLRERVAVPSRAERLEPACARLRAEPGVVDLPARLSLLGATRLTTAQLAVLAALAAGRDVHLWLPHPSPELWRRVAAQDPVTSRRRVDALTATAGAPRHPLLASLGRDARELQLQVQASAAAGGGAHTDEHLPVPAWPDTLLGRLQRSLAMDQPGEPGEPGEPAEPAGAEPGPLAEGDASLRVHACHGPERQVEVLREVLLGLLAADPTLEPRDVLVMCPDVEDFAPLVAATFGLGHGLPGSDAVDEAGAAHPGQALRVRLADRSLRQTNPLLDVAAALLELAGSRVTASEVLDLAATGPVRRRFRFADADLERLQEWAVAAGVRWGLDAAGRAPFGLESLPQNTWRTSLDRILLGAAMPGDGSRWLGTTLPLDGVGSEEIGLAGRLAELLERLTGCLRGLAGEQPLTAWADTLLSALDRLTEVGEAETWQATQARRALADVVAGAGGRAGSLPLRLDDVRSLLADLLRGRPTRSNFRTGELTVCSMVPMRSVPHRVVCLLGLDDGRFPRVAGTDGDDVLARDPHVGDRDRRSEDRQLLLDAVLAARDHLVVLYTGADPRTNAARPPAVPVGEILDAVDALVSTVDGQPAREHVVVRHPLQPFDGRNFAPGRLGTPGPFSFDRHALAGARRASAPRTPAGPFLAGPLPPADAAELTLEELVAFLEHPVKAFLDQRLGVKAARDEEELDGAVPVELDTLEQWKVGDRLLKARLRGVAPDAVVQAEWRRQTLPPGALGKLAVDEVAGVVEMLVAASAGLRVTAPRTVDCRGAVAGTVGGVHGDTVVRVEYSRLAPKHRLRAWAQLLALAAGHQSTAWTAATVGRDSGAGVAVSRLGPIEPAAAARLLADLADLHREGMREPLPVATKTSAAYAQARHRGMTPGNAESKAAREWDGDKRLDNGERRDAAHELVWGPAAPLAVLLAPPPAPEPVPDWLAGEPHRFGRLARRLWQPLLDHETLG